jgi:hypothetical protein
MFGKIKQAAKAKAMKMMLKSQMKGMSPEQQETIFKMMEKNPDFFEKIAKEIQDKVDGGGNQMYAAMQVMKKYQTELQGMFAGGAVPTGSTPISGSDK